MDWIENIIEYIPAECAGVVVLASFVIYLMFRYMTKSLDILNDMSDTLSELKGIIETLVPMLRDRIR